MHSPSSTSRERRGVNALFISLATMAFAACGGGPDELRTTTTSTPASTTSIAPVQSRHYVGTFPQAAPAPALPLDLSLFFNLPGGAVTASGLSPRAIFNVTGGYNTGPGGFTGSITGTLDGTTDSGTFTGVMTANLANGCVARRNYSGPLTAQALNWTPGAQIETCSGASPLVSQVNPPAAPPTSPATTSIAATTTTTSSSVASTSTTTTAQTTTTTTMPASTTSTTTSVGTVISSSTTTSIPPLSASYVLQGNECVLSSPSATCTFTASASGAVPPYTYRWVFSNPANGAQSSASGQSVNQAFSCPFSTAQTFTINVSMTVVASNGAQTTVTGSHRADRSFTIVCTFGETPR